MGVVVSGLLNNTIMIYNSVKKKDLPVLYSMSQVGSSFVTNIPELHYNSANKFFDTLAAGKPILINYKGWQYKIIKNKKLGFYLPYKYTYSDLENFSSFCMKLQHDSDINKRCLEFATENYSLDNLSHKYMKIIKSKCGLKISH